MDQATARELFKNGAIFIFLGVPEGTEFGIDMKSWNTCEKFRGVKMIPPGIHYIFYSSVSNTGDTAPRTGFFHNFKSGEVLVKKWDKTLEAISLEPVSEDEVVRLKDNIMALDQFLGPYPYDILEKWKSLTTCITESLIEKLMPLSGQVQSALELESCTDADRPKGKKISAQTAEDPDEPGTSCSSSKTPKRSKLSDDSEKHFLPDLKPKSGTELRVTPFPERCYPKDSLPSEITKHSLDSSFVLDTLVSTYEQPSDIIGELQFCYVCFLVGHSLESFEQWKKIFGLFCSCKTAIKKYRRLYDSYLSLVEVQVKEIPEDFLADIVSNNNFVYVKLRSLFSGIQNSDVDGEIKCKADRLRKCLSDMYQWDFHHLDSDDEDEAPVIVEIENLY